MFKGKRVKQKRGMEKAEIKALLVSKKSFSLQRLMHDYNEIKNQAVPLQGVSAVPLDDNFYEWHGNIKAITNNIYKGAVLHFKLQFPPDYPLSPPKVYVLNHNFKHPNVMPDNSICLDMFEKNKDSYKGWKTGYTVLSILLQLQMFFFDIDDKISQPPILGTNTSLQSMYSGVLNQNEQIKNTISDMNEFVCPECKHKGSSNPYPDFPKLNESNTKLNEEQYKKAKIEELCCYLRKVTFLEGPLGLGVSISKIPRTGEIKGVTPCFDFVSLKAYTKEQLRVGFNGEKFTHWFPLYFGIKQKEFLKSCTKAISMIAKGNTKEFKPELIAMVMPKFFNYISLNILSEKVHNSSRAIQILIYAYRILIMLSKEFPEFKEQANKNIEKFIKNPEERVKDKTPSLGDLLVLLTISDYKIEDLIPSYISEQMDRQIFWILQEIPELEKIINSAEVDDIRGKVCFKCGIVGEQLLLFYYYFLKKLVFADTDTLDKFAEKLDKNNGNLTENEIDKHRLEIDKILKVDSFEQFYQFLGMNPPSKNELNEKLKQAFKNSLAKKYHGFDEVRYVPPKNEQVAYYMKKYEPFENLIKDGKLLPAEDPKWKELLNRFDIVSLYKYTYPNVEMTPLNIVRFMRKKEADQLFFKPLKKKEEGHLENKVNKKKFVKIVEDEEIIQKLTWRQLYLKLYLEEYIKYFPFLMKFKELYSILDTVKDEIVHISINVSDEGLLKSDYNYIRVIMTKLTSLKYLELVFTKSITMKLIKNLVKGIANGLKDKAAIEHLKIIVNGNTYHYSTKELNILTILDNLPSLKVLDVSDMKLDINEILRIRNHLYYYKKISVIDLSNCSLNDEMCNELADGLMKAKGLEKIYLNNNHSIKGLTNILYNLAFQPAVKLVDISDNKSCDKKETATSLYKLIKMSQTIEYIIANSIKGLNEAFTLDFFTSIGDSNSLVYLDLSYNGTFRNIEELGNSIAFNALKNGSLSYVDISNCDLNYDRMETFIRGMSVSEDLHNKWYAFQLNSNIQKDSPDYFFKNFHCNLETLVMSNNYLACNINYLDPKNAKIQIEMKNLINKSPKLDTLILDFCSANKYFLDTISESLREPNNIKYLSLSHSLIDGEKFKSLLSGFYSALPKQELSKEKGKSVEPKKEDNGTEKIERLPNPNFHIEELDLSCNNIGFSGVETLSHALKINKSLKCLNLFHNSFDVDGARRLGEAMKINSSLMEIDVGYNRIKNVGLNSLLDGVISNKNSAIKYLGTKYNFINSKSFEKIMKSLEDNKDLKLEEIDLKNNHLNSGFLSKYWDKFKKMPKKIKTDVFDVLYYLEPDRLERTLWIQRGEEATREAILAEIERLEAQIFREEKDKEKDKNKISHVGIPLNIRTKRGRKSGEKKDKNPGDVFIEFMMPNSVNRMLKIASTTGFTLLNKKRKIFKAGTKPDYMVVKGKKKNNRNHIANPH